MSENPFESVSQSAERTKTYRCPCCDFKTLFGREGFEICPVCFWEDDGQDTHDADSVRGGPNGVLSLSEARKNFKLHQASAPKFLKSVRPPLADEI